MQDVPKYGAEEISGRRASKPGENPFGVAVQVGEPPISIESENTLADPVE